MVRRGCLSSNVLQDMKPDYLLIGLTCVAVIGCAKDPELRHQPRMADTTPWSTTGDVPREVVEWEWEHWKEKAGEGKWVNPQHFERP